MSWQDDQWRLEELRRREEEERRRQEYERREREERERRQREERERREREDQLRREREERERREREERERREREERDHYTETRTTDVQYGTDPATKALQEYWRLQPLREESEADMRVREQQRLAALAGQQAEQFRHEAEDAETRRVTAMIEVQRAEQAKDAAALDAARLEIERADADRASGERQAAQALADAEQHRLAAEVLWRSKMGVEDHPTLRADYSPPASPAEEYIWTQAHSSDFGRMASESEREEYAREQTDRAERESELQTFKEWYVQKRTSDLYEKLKEHDEVIP